MSFGPAGFAGLPEVGQSPRDGAGEPEYRGRLRAEGNPLCPGGDRACSVLGGGGA